MYHHMTTASEKGKDGQLSKHDAELEAHRHVAWVFMEFFMDVSMWFLLAIFFWELQSYQDSCLEDEVYKKSPLGWLCVPGIPVLLPLSTQTIQPICRSWILRSWLNPMVAKLGWGSLR